MDINKCGMELIKLGFLKRAVSYEWYRECNDGRPNVYVEFKPYTDNSAGLADTFTEDDVPELDDVESRNNWCIVAVDREANERMWSWCTFDMAVKILKTRLKCVELTDRARLLHDLHDASKGCLVSKLNLLVTMLKLGNYDGVLQMMYNANAGCPCDPIYVVDFGTKGTDLPKCTLEQAVVRLAELRDGCAYQNLDGTLVDISDTEAEVKEDGEDNAH